MGKALYFVNSIYKPIEGNKALVSLFAANTENEKKAIVIEIDRERLSMENHKGEIKEGWFVYYDNVGQFLFRYGNLSPYARKQFRLFNELRERLTQRFLDAETANASIPSQFYNKAGVNVTSYHVNVGHGNCSIILIQADELYNIWMVDCSVTDIGNWNNHTKNLQFCLNDIAKKLQLNDYTKLHIDRFFLTHTHYDHYNGIEYLVDNGYIDSNTICYINLYYHWASKTYLRVLDKLKNVNVRFVEPISNNSNSIITFFHPECRLYRSNATVVCPPQHYRIVNSPVNDSSTVIMFNIGNHTMVFTGDLEQKGFKAMSRATNCSPALNFLNYYIISHHGSINGHPDMPCMSPAISRSFPLICITNLLSKAILMGRDKAFHGIYSSKVVSYWSGLPGVLEYVERSSNFLELDWGSGNVTLK